MAYGQNMNAPMSGLMGLAAMKGRMGDNTLVHVNPMELKALDAMSPGGLTRNPTTGLPEAFKLKDILPTLGAIAGAAFLGPAAAAMGLTGTLGSAAAVGMGAAGGTALAGGNREEILGTGLTSALTAGMLGGLGGQAGAATGELTGGTGAELVAGQTAAGQTAGQMAAQSLAAPQTAMQGTMAGLDRLATQPLGASTIPFTPATASTATQTAADMAAKQLAAPSGLQAIAERGMQGIRDTGIGRTVGGAFGAAMSTPVNFPGGATGELRSTPYPQESTGVSKAEIDEYIRKGGQVPQFFRNLNQGGPISLNAGGQSSGMFSGMVDAKSGDGMSDNVSFEVVGDPQIKQAMLSPDEYVMDAYTVSTIGNGSSDAGAKKLDEFRQALREKTMGRREQPNQINGAKELSRLS